MYVHAALRGVFVGRGSRHGFCCAAAVSRGHNCVYMHVYCLVRPQVQPLIAAVGLPVVTRRAVCFHTTRAKGPSVASGHVCIATDIFC